MKVVWVKKFVIVRVWVIANAKLTTKVIFFFFVYFFYILQLIAWVDIVNNLKNKQQR